MLQTAGRHHPKMCAWAQRLARWVHNRSHGSGSFAGRARTLLDFKSYLDTCEEAAFTDHLSGLANRRQFERQLAREIARPTDTVIVLVF